MKDIQLLLKPTMIQAVVQGFKTQTRRLIKFQKQPINAKYITFTDGCWLATSETGTFPIKCPYGKVGDRLWVRETWLQADDGQFYYKRDSTPEAEKMREQYGYVWRSPIHMPKIACRMWLDIVDIRAERIQDISDADILAEGIREYKLRDIKQPLWSWEDYPTPELYGDARFCYKALWDSINGETSWKQNFWVWAISFKNEEQR